MYYFYADDGRILTPPKELEPLLKGSFLAFSNLLGHIRFFYMADEIWDGKSSLIFNANGEQLASITLDDGNFNINIADKDFQIADETFLNIVFETLKSTVALIHHRPFEQLGASPDPNMFPCGHRCDLCLGGQCYKKTDFSEGDNFVYLDWLCYNNCVPCRDIKKPPANDTGIFRCSGCNLDRNKFCRGYTCSKEKGHDNCAVCGEYHSCDVYKDSHYAGQCNLGITAEEVTKLVIPYCMKERLDIIRNHTK